jgi:hypothetical protein
MTTPASTTTGTRLRRRFIPPQHGAWAMLLVPWLAGVLTVGFRWLHVPLLGAWLSGYLFSYYLLQAVKTRRPHRVRRQLLVYATPTVLLGGLILALRPQLLWYAPAYAALFAVNVGYAVRRNERTLLNDLTSVAQSSLIIFVCATLAAAPTARVWPAFLAVAAYFTGTVLYVKTMIRERGHAGYYRASVAYHLAILALATWWRPPVAILFAMLLARAAVLPRLPMTPKQVGIIEIAASALVVVTLTFL